MPELQNRPNYNILNSIGHNFGEDEKCKSRLAPHFDYGDGDGFLLM